MELEQTPLAKSHGGTNNKVTPQPDTWDEKLDRTFDEQTPDWAEKARTGGMLKSRGGVPELSPKTRYTHHAQAASDRADDIRTYLRQITDNYREAAVLIAEAWTQRDYLSMGYRNWTEYAAGEWGKGLAKMTPAMRDEFTPLLAALGMPKTAIAEIEGIDRKTLQRDEKRRKELKAAAAATTPEPTPPTDIATDVAVPEPTPEPPPAADETPPAPELEQTPPPVVVPGAVVDGLAARADDEDEFPESGAETPRCVKFWTDGVVSFSYYEEDLSLPGDTRVIGERLREVLGEEVIRHLRIAIAE